MREVMTPTGSPEGSILTAMVSATASMRAPPKADAGIRYRLSEPMSIRMTCGATSPTNPIVPEKQTRIAVTRDTMIIMMMRVLRGLRPRDTDSLSVYDRRLSLALSSDKDTIPMAEAAITNGRCCHCMLPKVPKAHVYIWTYWVGEAMRFSIVVAALNTYITDTPTNIIIAGLMDFTIETPTMNNAGTRDRAKALTIMPAWPLRNGITDMPYTMARDIPKFAPEEIPVM